MKIWIVEDNNYFSPHEIDNQRLKCEKMCKNNFQWKMQLQRHMWIVIRKIIDVCTTYKT